MGRPKTFRNFTVELQNVHEINMHTESNAGSESHEKLKLESLSARLSFVVAQSIMESWHRVFEIASCRVIVALTLMLILKG